MNKILNNKVTNINFKKKKSKNKNSAKLGYKIPNLQRFIRFFF